jgi:hypothetical protein
MMIVFGFLGFLIEDSAIGVSSWSWSKIEVIWVGAGFGGSCEEDPSVEIVLCSVSADAGFGGSCEEDPSVEIVLCSVSTDAGFGFISCNDLETDVSLGKIVNLRVVLLRDVMPIGRTCSTSWTLRVFLFIDTVFPYDILSIEVDCIES